MGNPLAPGCGGTIPPVPEVAVPGCGGTIPPVVEVAVPEVPAAGAVPPGGIICRGFLSSAAAEPEAEAEAEAPESALKSGADNWRPISSPGEGGSPGRKAMFKAAEQGHDEKNKDSDIKFVKFMFTCKLSCYKVATSFSNNQTRQGSRMFSSAV